MTPFVCDETLESVLDKLEGNSEIAIFWFENNCMNTAQKNEVFH